MTTVLDTAAAPVVGQLAKQWCNKHLPLQVLQTVAGYYIGTADEWGPVSRESNEYFANQALASEALARGRWTQKTAL